MKTRIPFSTKIIGDIPGIDDFPCIRRLSSSYDMWRVWDTDESCDANNQGIVSKSVEGPYRLVIPCQFFQIIPVPFGNTAQEPVLFEVNKKEKEDQLTIFDIDRGRILTFQIAGQSGSLTTIQDIVFVDGPANAPVFLINKHFLFNQKGEDVLTPLPGQVHSNERITTFKDEKGELKVLALCYDNGKPVACLTGLDYKSSKIVVPKCQ